MKILQKVTALIIKDNSYRMVYCIHPEAQMLVVFAHVHRGIQFYVEQSFVHLLLTVTLLR